MKLKFIQKRTVGDVTVEIVSPNEFLSHLEQLRTTAKKVRFSLKDSISSADISRKAGVLRRRDVEITQDCGKN